MKAIQGWILAAGVAAVVAGMVLIGCESTKTSSDVIAVSPASVTLTNATTVIFTATLGNTNLLSVLPLVWTVSDSTLGTISGGGMSAVYSSTGKVGNNKIMVRDQADGEGMAEVMQIVPGSTNTTAMTNTNTPSVTTNIINNTIYITPTSYSWGAGITGTVVFTATLNNYSVLPLKWTVSDQSLGYIVTNVDSTTHTVSINFNNMPGTNTLIVQDAGMGLGSAIMYHQ